MTVCLLVRDYFRVVSESRVVIAQEIAIGVFRPNLFVHGLWQANRNRIEMRKWCKQPNTSIIIISRLTILTKQTKLRKITTAQLKHYIWNWCTCVLCSFFSLHSCLPFGTVQLFGIFIKFDHFAMAIKRMLFVLNLILQNWNKNNLMLMTKTGFFLKAEQNEF